MCEIRREFVWPSERIITGITGQDGSYLAELLLDEGLRGRSASCAALSAPNFWRIEHLLDRITLQAGRPARSAVAASALIDEVRPHELYNLAAMSFVPASWDQPMLTGEFNAQGVTRVLDAVRQVDPKIRFYQASSSEMFGKVREVPQTELTPFYPRSPYGVSKVFAHYITVNYRESYDLFAVSGMLFNHESPRRGLEFVTRKVTDGVARIKLGLADTLSLGNLDAQRDWGFAGDYVRAMWLMLQQERADDYVIATGVSHSVRELVEVAFAPRRPRLAEARAARSRRCSGRPKSSTCIGDSRRRAAQLGWTPTVDFTQLVEMMVDADLERVAAAPRSRSPVDAVAAVDERPRTMTLTHRARFSIASGPKQARVGVIGLGYVGLPLAVEFARAGFDVTGFDVDARKTDADQRRHELHPRRRRTRIWRRRQGRQAPRDDRHGAARRRWTSIDICVPTPLRKTKDPGPVVRRAGGRGGGRDAAGAGSSSSSSRRRIRARPTKSCSRCSRRRG